MSRSANATLTRCAPPRSASLSGGGGTPGGRGGAPRPARGRRGRAVARRRARRPARAPRPRPRRGRVACGAPAPAPARPTALNLVCNSPQVLFWGWLYTRAPSGGTLAPPAAWRAHRGRAGGRDAECVGAVETRGVAKGGLFCFAEEKRGRGRTFSRPPAAHARSRSSSATSTDPPSAATVGGTNTCTWRRPRVRARRRPSEQGPAADLAARAGVVGWRRTSQCGARAASSRSKWSP